jgi:hypothetical protein
MKRVGKTARRVEILTKANLRGHSPDDSIIASFLSNSDLVLKCSKATSQISPL